MPEYASATSAPTDKSMMEFRTRLVRVNDTIHYPDCSYVARAKKPYEWHASAQYSDEDVWAMRLRDDMVSPCRRCLHPSSKWRKDQ